MPKLILSVGRDLLLLKKRTSALHDAGYTVVAATDPRQAIADMFNGDFDLVLLCHSLTNEERERFAGIVRNYSPSTPVVIISDLEGRKYPYGTRTLRCYSDQILAAFRYTLATHAPIPAPYPPQRHPLPPLYSDPPLLLTP